MNHSATHSRFGGMCLAHGGSPVHDATLTRQSLVGHFCPATARPRYFDHGQQRDTVRRYGPLLYSSDHYDLSTRAEHVEKPTKTLFGKISETVFGR